ncbi:hypothetical protein B0T22DRAFT_276593 [Podospora appendiculata]|uniref:Secreted protein n=1 Tax=Podospora appendiculata TaxID=314037 RepID=A0AAE1C7W1_9PEZI|nr:hypothetical protein B0T22DRAFT_276593 [Podospora appendiculata]
MVGRTRALVFLGIELGLGLGISMRSKCELVVYVVHARDALANLNQCGAMFQRWETGIRVLKASRHVWHPHVRQHLSTPGILK